jgi:Fur family transcriptional regulator, ferric uptake regulator
MAMTTPEEPLNSPVLPELDACLAQAGLRRTRATLAVLGLFARQPGWWAGHADVEQAMSAVGLEVNRVTLYRLLDRLAHAGLLLRRADDPTRTWRFALSPGILPTVAPSAPAGSGGSEVVPRFECDACHCQFELVDASTPTQAVAQQLLQALASLGHHGQRVDLAVHGTCAGCASPDGGPSVT